MMHPHFRLKNTLRRWSKSGGHDHWTVLVRAEVRWLLSCGESLAGLQETASEFGYSL